MVSGQWNRASRHELGRASARSRGPESSDRITGYGYATSPNWNQLYAQRMAEIHAQEAKERAEGAKDSKSKAKARRRKRSAVKP